jgi:hypothetical protein
LMREKISLTKEFVFDLSLSLAVSEKVCFGLFPCASPQSLKGIYRPWASVAGEWWHTIHRAVHLETTWDDAIHDASNEQSHVSDCT